MTLCSWCGAREATETLDDREICEVCLKDLERGSDE